MENTLTDQELVAPQLPEQRDPNVSDLSSGWHKVALSEEVAVKQAIQVDDFATQIVVWRGEDLKLRGLDLYCKHMGSSLACGEVAENSIKFLMQKKYLLKQSQVLGRLLRIMVQYMYGLIRIKSLQIQQDKSLVNIRRDE